MIEGENDAYLIQTDASTDRVGIGTSSPNAKLEVSLATPEDLVMIGAAHQPPSALNFFTRRNNRGEGVIVITSSRPMTDAELNIIIKNLSIFNIFSWQNVI